MTSCVGQYAIIFSHSRSGGPARGARRFTRGASEDLIDSDLSRRERQVMETVYALGSATPRDVVDEWNEEGAYDSVRVIMANLWKEGRLRREKEGRSYLYAPAVPRQRARRKELSHLLRTYFPNSPSQAVRAFLDVAEDELTEEDLEEISGWIDDHIEARRD